MQNIFSSIANNLDVFIPILLVSLALVVIYLVFIVRTVIDMLQYDVQGVLLTFAFIALIPLPPAFSYGDCGYDHLALPQEASLEEKEAIATGRDKDIEMQIICFV